MRNASAVAVALAFLPCAVQPAAAAFTAADARGIGLGGAMVAVPGDVSVSLWNPALLAFNTPAVSDRLVEDSGRNVTLTLFGIHGLFFNNAVTREEAGEFQEAGEPAEVSSATRNRVWDRVRKAGGIKGVLAVGGFHGLSIGNMGIGMREELSVRLVTVSTDAAYLLLFSPSKEDAINAANNTEPQPDATCPPHLKPNTRYGVQVSAEEKIGNDYPITYARVLPLSFLGSARMTAGVSARILDGGQYLAQEAFVDFTTGASVCEEVPRIDRNYVSFTRGADGVGVALDLGLAMQVNRQLTVGWSLANLFYYQRWKAVREIYTWDLDPKSASFLEFRGYSEAIPFVDHDPVTVRMGASWIVPKTKLAIVGQLEGTPADRLWRIGAGTEKNFRFGALRGGLVYDTLHRLILLNLGAGLRLGAFHWDLAGGISNIPPARAMGVTFGTSMALWF